MMFWGQELQFSKMARNKSENFLKDNNYFMERRNGQMVIGIGAHTAMIGYKGMVHLSGLTGTDTRANF